ncbi:MAG: glycosyltransferase [Acidobacteriia bacterium]|nr:glycosyltransferase [Terriglobia bacterium]
MTHLITGLCAGGAEIMLLRLLSATDRSRFDVDVISMMEIGITGEKIRGLGFRVRTLEMERERPSPLALTKLVSWLRRDRPQILATWMYHANFLGSLVAPLAGGMPVVWGLHHGFLDVSLERRRTILVARACGWMSRHLAAKVICCSECTRQQHIPLGYDPSKMVVIRNGFDLDLFQPERGRRDEVRRELQIPADAPILFQAGRFHPEKDYRTLVEAAAILHQRVPEARFVLCGHDVTWKNETLAGWIDRAGLRDSFRLLGRRDDIPRLLNAADIASSSSVGEAFSLAIGEAMCCEIPCVVTDVGDSAFEVGDTGRVVPSRSPQAFADAWASLLAMSQADRAELGRGARRRIEQNFSLPVVTAQYEQLYESVVREVEAKPARHALPSEVRR